MCLANVEKYFNKYSLGSWMYYRINLLLITNLAYPQRFTYLLDKKRKKCCYTFINFMN